MPLAIYASTVCLRSFGDNKQNEKMLLAAVAIVFVQFHGKQNDEFEDKFELN